ncbi:regulatory protein GemA [Oleomonas cavernae]|nr:regulatory protein GemA [Oleomonas cavernae]
MKGAHNPDARKRLIAAVHAEAKRQGLDDELRREVIFQATGKRSSAELTNNELGKALDAIKGRSGARARAPKGRALADSAHARKIRALWLSLWALGAVDDASEGAIASFAERQCGVQALQWVSAHDASRIIEALRAWCEREGFKVKPGVDTEEANRLLVTAQMAKLIALAEQGAIDSADVTLVWGTASVREARKEQVATIIRGYGDLIRKAKRGQA